MGVVEQKARRLRRIGAFQKALLATVAIGGVVLLAAAMPNAAQLLRYFPGYKKGAKFTYQAKSALGRLVAKGLITFIEEDGKRYARITDEGRRFLDLEKEKMLVQKKRRWDQRWRVVVFDIPERRKNVRAKIRLFMQESGFVRLQDSVWIYPYECEELLALAKAEFRIGAEVLYMVVEQLERDHHLREHFSLPLDS